MKSYFVAGMLCLLAVYGAVSYASAEAPVVVNDIRFTDEMWAKALLEASKVKPVLVKNLSIDLPAPPANDSKETRADLDVMLKQQANDRTPETIELIKAENNTLPFYAFEKSGLLDAATHKKTEALLIQMDTDVSSYIYQQKLKFKRARPTQLEPKLTTVIPVPPHAAYPSGHSTQIHAAAYLLSHFDPANKAKYEKLAHDFAVRREIAGVHYPGDTKAGMTLARAYIDQFVKDPELQPLMVEAQAEFKK